MKRIIVFSVLLGLVLLIAGIPREKESLQTVSSAFCDTTAFYVVCGKVDFGDNGEPLKNGYVKALMYDKDKDIIVTIDSTRLQDGGYYCLPKCRRDSLFIMAYGDDEMDGMPGYHDTTINWQFSVPVSFYSKHNDIDIKVNRNLRHVSGSFIVNGRIYSQPNQNDFLEDAVVYAKLGNQFLGYSISNPEGLYTIDSLPAGNYEIIVSRLGYYLDYRLIQIGQTNIDTVNFYLSKVASVNIPHGKVPVEYSLFQNYPNPFNPATKIKFDLPKPDLTLSGAKGLHVRLIIYDALGREVAVLVNQQFQPGRYEIEWDGTNYPSGVYYYKLISGDYTQTRKMVLIK